MNQPKEMQPPNPAEESFPPVSVIVLNWNGLAHLEEYLPALAATDYPNLELILADNASNDGSVEMVKSRFPQFRVLELDQNYGYCGGNNRAAEAADGELLVFLNNDVRVEQTWLKPMVRLFKEFPKLAAVQPVIRSDRYPEFFDYAGAAGGMLDELGYPWCRGRVFDAIERDTGQYGTYPVEIFWASGAAFCVRRDLFLEAGGFDEDFVLHMEEIDLCWRLQRAGWEIRVSPDSVVRHLGGGTLAQGNPRKMYFNIRNSLAMLTKNYRTAALIPVMAARLMFDAAIGIRFLLRGDIPHHLAVWQAYRDFYAKLPYWLEKRGTLNRELPDRKNPTGFEPVSKIWEYLLKKGV